MSSRARIVRNRVVFTVPVFLLATFVAFGILELVPGDIALVIAGDSATPERLAEIRGIYGLDHSFGMQYVIWLGHALRGDLSRSLLSGEAVTTLIVDRLPNTLLLTGLALLLSIVLGIPLGIAGAKGGALIDRAVRLLTTLFVAMPSFWLGMILVSFFALSLGWLPATGGTRISDDMGAALLQMILPAIALSASGTASIARQVRSALRDVFASQYVRTLRAKGLSARSILWKHGLRNVAATILTTIGLLFNRLLSTAVVIEAVFAIPGLGGLVIPAALARDFPVVQGVVLATAIMVVLCNLAIDLIVLFLDPRKGLARS